MPRKHHRKHKENPYLIRLGRVIIAFGAVFMAAAALLVLFAPGLKWPTFGLLFGGLSFVFVGAFVFWRGGGEANWWYWP